MRRSMHNKEVYTRMKLSAENDSFVLLLVQALSLVQALTLRKTRFVSNTLCKNSVMSLRSC